MKITDILYHHCRPATEEEILSLLPKDRPVPETSGARCRAVIYGTLKTHIDCSHPYRLDDVITYDLVTHDAFCALANSQLHWEVFHCEDIPALVTAMRDFNKNNISNAVDEVFTRLLEPPTVKPPIISLFHEGFDRIYIHPNHWTTVSLPFITRRGFPVVHVFELSLPFVGDRVTYYYKDGIYYRTLDRDSYLYSLAIGGEPYDAEERTPTRLTLSDLESGKEP